MSPKDMPRDRAAELVGLNLRFAVHGLSASYAEFLAEAILEQARGWRDREAALKRERAQWRREHRYHEARDEKPKPPQQGRRPHDVLGISSDATVQEIAAAYRSAARKAHPDAGGSHVAMAEVNAARDTMMKGRKAA